MLNLVPTNLECRYVNLEEHNRSSKTAMDLFMDKECVIIVNMTSLFDGTFLDVTS